MKPRSYYEAIATLTGCVIGAGIFAIPFVVVQAGFWTGMLVLAGLGIGALVIHLMAGEICLRFKKDHQLVGHASRTLGRPGKYLMTAAMMIGIYGALVAYTLGVGQSLKAIFGGVIVLWMVVFYLIMAFLLSGGLRTLQKSELFMEGIKFIIFAVIIVILFSSAHFSPDRLSGFSWKTIFIPYGVFLFAYVSTAAIPEMRAELRKHPKLLKKAITKGMIISFAVYALFAAAVAGVSGAFTTEVATIGLAEIMNGSSIIFLHLFAIFAMATSFIGLGFALKEMYEEDFNMTHSESWIFTLAVPAVILMVGVASFVKTLDIAGAFTGGIAGITIVFMHYKAKKMSEREPEFKLNLNWFSYILLMVLFFLGIVYQLSLML